MAGIRMDPGIIFQGKSNCSEKNRSYCERSEQQQIEKNDGQNCKKTLTYPPRVIYWSQRKHQQNNQAWSDRMDEQFKMIR